MAVFGNKAVLLALLLVAMVMAASVAPSDQAYPCFCNCMKKKCMTIGGATKEECARACDGGCIQAGYHGQSSPKDFCGY